MRIEIKKLYEGRIELRDYDVQKCILNGKSMEVIHSGDRMILTPKDLTDNRVSVSKTFESKIPGGKSYKLFGYVWEPEEVEL
jgi:hypothetical protein